MIKCVICNKEIPEDQIPQEAKEKIGLQMFWHYDCLEADQN